MFSKIFRGVIFAEPSKNNDPSPKEKKKNMQVSRPNSLAAPQDDPVTFIVGGSASERKAFLRR